LAPALTKEIDMDTVTAVFIAEGVQEAKSEQEMIEAWQYLIDTGIAWQLQGWFGRTAQHLIDEGICLPPDSSRA
jgi:hypothetical protein